MKELFVRNVSIPFAILLSLNLANYLWLLPVSLQMVASALLLIYIGCILSASIKSASYTEIKSCEKQLNAQGQAMNWCQTCWLIVKYPLIATIMLLILYFSIKYLDIITKDFILDLIFIASTTYYGTITINPYISKYVSFLTDHYALSTAKQRTILFILKYGIAPMLFILVSLLEVVTKYWLIDNLYAIALCILAIKHANLNRFVIALPMLWVLFFYDLYWVYQSDVMVTVAKNINLPLRLKFPYLGEDALSWQFSMLGLGDVVLPGMLLSLCLKYDIDNCILRQKRPTKLQQFTFPLFNSTMLAYTLSLMTTYLAMLLFKQAQPALVFIVPFCSASILMMQVKLKNKISVWKYSTSVLTSKREEGIII